jgi:hypothetical protein
LRRPLAMFTPPSEAPEVDHCPLGTLVRREVTLGDHAIETMLPQPYPIETIACERPDGVLHGPWIERTDHSSRIKHYRDGKRHGVSQYWGRDGLNEEEWYVDGEVQYGRVWSWNGRLLIETRRLPDGSSQAVMYGRNGCTTVATYHRDGSGKAVKYLDREGRETELCSL